MYDIRILREDDVSVICALSSQLGYNISEAQTAANIRAILADPTHRALVATDNATVIGWAHAFKSLTIESLPFIELAGLIVDERCRNQGVGQLLVSAVKVWCAESGIGILCVRSNVIRTDAHRFYFNQGFSELKQQKVFQLNLQ